MGKGKGRQQMETGEMDGAEMMHVETHGLHHVGNEVEAEMRQSQQIHEVMMQHHDVYQHCWVEYISIHCLRPHDFPLHAQLLLLSLLPLPLPHLPLSQQTVQSHYYCRSQLTRQITIDAADDVTKATKTRIETKECRKAMQKGEWPVAAWMKAVQLMQMLLQEVQDHLLNHWMSWSMSCHEPSTHAARRHSGW